MNYSSLLLLILIIILMHLITYKTMMLCGSFENRADCANVIYYFRLDTDKHNYKKSIDLHSIMQDVLIKNGAKCDIVKSKSYILADFLLFDSLDKIDTVMNVIHYPHKCRFIYGVNGTDNLASKSMLYKCLRESLSPKTLSSIVPTTYILKNPNDVNRLKSNKKNDKTVYIAKKNIQRQSGVILFTDPNTELGEGYVVVQELLQNPYLVNGKKINLRVYMLITVDALDVNFYYYTNGFLYFTPENFKPMSLNPRENITSGFGIDRDVYKTNPLTIQDLKNDFGSQKSKIFDDNLKDLFKVLKYTYSTRLRAENLHIPGIKFLIYGCDLAPDKDLNIMLMEINKGPDLTYKDSSKDKELKMDLVKDTFELVGLLKTDNININKFNKYIKIN